MGDGTNFVIVLAGELLKKAQQLFKMGLHVSEVIDGYRAACKKIREILPGMYLPSQVLVFYIFFRECCHICTGVYVECIM